MAFGDNSFGDSKPTIGRRGRGNRGGIGGGGGNNRNRNRNRNRNPNQGPAGPQQDIGDAWSAPVPSSGDPFGDVTPGGTFGGGGSLTQDPDATGDADAWLPFATGVLNQGGIFTDRAFGSQQGEWLNEQLQNWHTQWEGAGGLAGDDAQTWDQYLYGIPGTTAPASGAVTDGWLQDTWGPAMQQYLTARYQAQTPRQRGTQQSAWTGPRRVIQFLVTLASAGAIVAEFVSKAIGA